MIYGFENEKFYIDFFPVREESDHRALEIANIGSKFIISFSGGLDSQAVLHSFYKYDIAVETAFLYLPTYNDQEYKYFLARYKSDIKCL